MLHPEEHMLINLIVSEHFHGVDQNNTCHFGSSPKILSKTFSQVCIPSLETESRLLFRSLEEGKNNAFRGGRKK